MDAEVQALRRRWDSTRSSADEIALLRGLLKAGRLDSARVAAAAGLGHASAQALVGTKGPSSPFREVVRHALQMLDVPNVIAMGVHLAEEAAHTWSQEVPTNGALAAPIAVLLDPSANLSALEMAESTVEEARRQLRHEPEQCVDEDVDRPLVFASVVAHALAMRAAAIRSDCARMCDLGAWAFELMRENSSNPPQEERRLARLLADRLLMLWP